MMRWFSWGSISSCDRPKSLRQALPAPLPDADNRSVWHASSEMTIIIECHRRCRKNPHSLNGQVCQVLENVKPFTGTCIVLWRLHIKPPNNPPPGSCIQRKPNRAFRIIREFRMNQRLCTRQRVLAHNSERPVWFSLYATSVIRELKEQSLKEIYF